MKNTKREIKRSEYFEPFLFFLRLLILAVPFKIGLYLEPKLVLLQDIVASHSVFILNLIGKSSFAKGVWIMAENISINVIPACTGWRSDAAFLALVWAVPNVNLKKRLKALWAIPVIYGINIARLVTVVLAAGTTYFKLLHDVLWREGLITVVLSFWLIWWKKVD